MLFHSYFGYNFVSPFGLLGIARIAFHVLGKFYYAWDTSARNGQNCVPYFGKIFGILEIDSIADLWEFFLIIIILNRKGCVLLFLEFKVRFWLVRNI